MSREAENPNHNDTVLEPPDSDYRFSAKVSKVIKELMFFSCKCPCQWIKHDEHYQKSW